VDVQGSAASEQSAASQEFREGRFVSSLVSLYLGWYSIPISRTGMASSRVYLLFERSHWVKFLPISRGEGHDVHFPLSTVSYYRNYFFHGRDDLLNRMSQHLGDSKLASDATAHITTSPLTVAKGHDPKCCIIHGLGGIGKTQTAVEYTHRYQDSYDAIFWVQSDSDQALATSFSDIAEKLRMIEDLGGHDGQNQGRAIKRAEKWLRSTGERIVSSIFSRTDNR
jgi:hypothetical protein